MLWRVWYKPLAPINTPLNACFFEKKWTQCWMFILMEVQMEQAHQQPQQSMAGWLEALMQTHWRCGQREQQEWGGLSEEMDSTRAELLGAYAVLHKVRQY